MTFVTTPYAVVSAAAACVALVVTITAWLRRGVPCATALAAIMLSATIWSGAAALEYAAVELHDKVFLSSVSYFGIVSCPVFFLIFALQFNQLDHWITKRTMVLLFIVPVLTLIVVWTNPWHGLFWPSFTWNEAGDNLLIYAHGPAFWLGAVGYSYLTMAAGTWLFLRAARRLRHHRRRQAVMIMVAALAPWVVNMIYIIGASPAPGLELTPLVMVVSGLIFAWSIFGLQLLNLTPMARRMLTEIMDDGMIVLDAQDRVADINPAAQRILCCTATTALEQHIDALLPPGVRWQTLVNATAAQEVELVSCRHTHYLEMNIAPIRDRRDRRTGRLVVMHDVTARRLAEDTLRRRNDYLNALQQTAMELIAQLDLARLLENIVLRAGQLVGTDSGYLDLVEPGADCLRPQVGTGTLAESLKHPARRGEGLAGKVWQSGQPLVIEDYDAWAGRFGAFSHGTIQSIVGVPLRVGEEVVGVLGLAYPSGATRRFSHEEVDILTQFASLAAIAIANARLYTQAQREKQYFESLFTNVPTATIIVDLEGRVASWNPAATALFGYSQVEAVGQFVDTLITAETQVLEAQLFLQKTLEGSQVHVITQRARKDDSVIDVELSALPIVIDSKPVGALANYHDITALQQARQAAEAAARAKSEFLARMSHELRTPLNAVLGFASLLARDASLSHTQQEYVTTINRSGEHLLALINDVLDMAKVESGRMTLHETICDLHRLLDDLMEMFRLRALARRLQITLVRDAVIPQLIMTDERKLRQVLINLLGNAIKFTEHGGVTVTMTAQGEADARQLRIDVQDTGAGIAPEDIAAIFEPFVQVAGGRTDQEGTGLGLPISREFARLMGGDLTVSSTGVQGEGSTFRLELPLRALVASDAGMADNGETAKVWQPTTVSPDGIAPDAWGVLPVAWRAQVRLAALTADADRLHVLAAQVPVAHAALALTLRQWIEAFDYAAIIAAMLVD